MKRKSVVTIEDVAREAGVSPSSVSNAFNQRLSRMSGKTRERILEAAARLDYRPNAAASSLRSRRTNTIGLLVTNIVNPFYAGVVRAVQDAARRAGYWVLLGNTDDDPAQEREMLALMRAKQVEGILLVTTGGNHTLIKQVKSAGTAVVLLDRSDPGLRMDTVRVDNEGSSQAAVRHLLDAGHRRIGFIGGSVTGVPTRLGRMAGYEAAFREAGLPVPAAYEKTVVTDSARGYAAALELLGAGHPPTALFVTNTFLAMGALQAVRDRGVRIPEEMSFVMFDDPDWARLTSPPITTVAQPVAQIGEEALRLLLDRLRGFRGAARDVVLPTRLEIRQSCAAPPRGR